MSVLLCLLACCLTQQAIETNATNRRHIEAIDGVLDVAEGGDV